MTTTSTCCRVCGWLCVWLWLLECHKTQNEWAKDAEQKVCFVTEWINVEPLISPTKRRWWGPDECSDHPTESVQHFGEECVRCTRSRSLVCVCGQAKHPKRITWIDISHWYIALFGVLSHKVRIAVALVAWHYDNIKNLYLFALPFQANDIACARSSTYSSISMMTSLCFVFFVLSAIPYDSNNNGNVEVNETKRNANGATEEKFNSFSSFFRSLSNVPSYFFFCKKKKIFFFRFVSFNVCSVGRLRSQARIVNSAHVAC